MRCDGFLFNLLLIPVFCLWRFPILSSGNHLHLVHFLCWQRGDIFGFKPVQLLLRHLGLGGCERVGIFAGIMLTPQSQKHGNERGSPRPTWILVRNSSSPRYITVKQFERHV